LYVGGAVTATNMFIGTWTVSTATNVLSSPYAGIFTITNITAATSTNTGALQVAGGAGISGSLYVGSISTFTNIVVHTTTTAATSTATGALQVVGGIGLGGSLYVGGDTVLTGDILVGGGDVNTTATTFNLISSTATTVNFASAATTLNIGNTATAAQIVNMFTASSGASTYNFAVGPTANATTKTINIGTAGVSGSTTAIAVGSAVSGATTNLTFNGAIVDATTFNTAKSVGYLGSPINPQAGAYTLVIGDTGKTIYAGGNLTIPANSSVAFPVGTVINIIASAGITVAITTDTLQWGGQASSTTGTRTIAQYGMATLVKVTSTIWYISGAGVT
jgi:hypothetical protein